MRMSDWSAAVCSSDLDAPSDGDKVIASDEGGEISESGKPAPQAEAGGERADSGTVVGAMESSNAIRSEQASSAGGVKAMPAVRAMARKLRVDLSRVRGTGADGGVTMAHSSEGRRVGKECAMTCQSSVSPYPTKNNNTTQNTT